MELPLSPRTISEIIEINQPNGLCTLTRKQLAAELGCTVRQVSYHLDRMALAGKIVKKGSRFGVVKPTDGAPQNVKNERNIHLPARYYDLLRLCLRSAYHFSFQKRLTYPFFLFLLMAAQTVHTYKFIYFVSGADNFSFVYAILTALGMDYILYTLALKGERWKVREMLAFYVIANIYAFNHALFSHAALTSDWVWSAVLDGRVWISLVPSYYIPHVMVQLSEMVAADKRRVKSNI